MPYIDSRDIDSTLGSMDDHTKLQVYNGLDCMMTEEIFQVLDSKCDEISRRTYNFERALMGPVLHMSTRGLLVDVATRAELIMELSEQAQKLLNMFRYIVKGYFNHDLDKISPQFLCKMFYQWLRLPQQFKLTKGVKTLSAGREALEKLSVFPSAKPFCNILLRYRDITKKLGTIKSAVDSDNRLRASFNIAGTETGRFSSSSNAFGTGTNLQNITEELRRLFIADSGHKFAYIDLEQAESRLVGILSWLATGRDDYLNACEGGDLHTTVCRMVWPNLEWTGDLKHDKKIVAGASFYRQFSYRDMAKRGGHGTNYYGTPRTMAGHLKVEPRIMEEFQSKYFKAFSEIPEWHLFVKRELQTKGYLITPLGRRRHFFGRRDDDSTLREAIAFVPQSTIADYEDLGLYRVFEEGLNKRLPVEVMIQVHDAVLIMYPEEKETEVLEAVKKILRFTFTLNGRTFSIPVEAKSGWNWSNYDENKNPDGLKLYNGTESRTRQRSATTTLMDARLS